MDKRNRRILLYTFLFSILAHLYRWTNAAFVHDALLVYQNDYRWQTSLGRYLMQGYLQLRKPVTAPLLIGVIATSFLCVSIILIAKILDIRRPSDLVLLCGVLSVNVHTFSSYASYLPWADIYMLSLLFAVLGAYVQLSNRKRWLLSSVLLAISMGLYPTYIEVFVVVCLLWILLQIIRQRPLSEYVSTLYSSILASVSGGILYYLGWLLSLSVLNYKPASRINSVGNIWANLKSVSSIPRLLRGTYTSFFRNLLFPITAAQKAVAVCNLIAGVICLILLIRRFHSSKNRKSLAVCLILAALFPLFANFVFILSNGYLARTMIYSFSFLQVGMIMLFANMKEADRRGILSSLLAVALLVPVSSDIIYANQLYLQKDLEYQSTIAVISRVTGYIEKTEGYVPDETLVVLVGDLNKSKIAPRREGFPEKTIYGTTYYEVYEQFFYYIMGYPINLASIEVSAGYSEAQEVIEMPAFPDPGCVKMMEGVLVVKLSETSSAS